MPNGMEFVILTCCCALLPTFTEPKFMEVALAVTEEAAALRAVIKANSWIIVTRDGEANLFRHGPICPYGRDCGTNKIYRALWIFYDGGSLRISREQRLLAWRHERGQGETLSPDVPARNAALNWMKSYYNISSLQSRGGRVWLSASLAMAGRAEELRTNS
jgi:hypothetical protein